MQIFNPGEVVANRFRIVRFLAEGGMGEVYEAEDQVLGEPVALKFLSRRSMGRKRVLQRFRREIQLARKVTHANVCRTFDVFEHQPRGGGASVSFVTMELLRGETLEDHLKRRGPLTIAEAGPLARQMADALTAAHGAGVIHRDFKSANVMLVPGAKGLRAVVTDFGLARPVESNEPPPAPERPGKRTPITGEYQLIGTADYMAPEQLMGEEVTPLADIYAFGVVLFEMVTAEKPYKSGSLVTLLARRVSEPPASPREFVPDLDPTWERVILQCLDRDPSLRPANSWEVVVALMGGETFQGAQSTAGYPRPPLDLLLAEEHSSSPPLRDRRLLIAFATVLIISALGLVGIWLIRSPEPALWLGTPVRVTSAGGLELDPAFSPDGRFLVYSSDKSGHFELWLQDLATNHHRQLTSAGEEVFEPAFAPTSEALAYHSEGRGGIWLLPLDSEGNPSGLARQLSPFGSRPAFSPDGRSLAFQSESSPQLSDTTAPALGPSTLWRVDLAGGESVQLTRPGAPKGGHATPAFSPDGRRLVFSTSLYGRSEIWTLDLESGVTAPVVRDPAGSYDPVYSPDGREIYFSAVSRQVYGLWRVPISQRSGRPTGAPVQIRNIGLASIRQLALSADGRRIAYTAMQTSSELWSMPLAETGLPSGPAEPLTRLGGRNNRPAFSFDGERIVFDHWQLGLSIDLWIIAARGGAPQRITQREADDTQGQWLSSHRLAFRAEDMENRGLWTVDLDAEADVPTPVGDPQSLVELPAKTFWATLSPAAPRMAYHIADEDGGRTIWVQELGGERLARISSRDLADATPEDHTLGFPVWSHDGSWLAFQHRQGEDRTHVMVLAADGGEAVQLTHGDGENWPYSFSPDGDKVAFAARRNGAWGLWWVSRSTGEEMRLTPAPKLNQYMRYPTWSPQGDQLVYELASSVGDIFLLETEAN